MHLNVLLANKLKEFAHLLNRWFIALAVVPAAWTVPVMLFLLSVKDVFYDGLQLRR